MDLKNIFSRSKKSDAATPEKPEVQTGEPVQEAPGKPGFFQRLRARIAGSFKKDELPEQIIAFQPDALEIKNQRLPFMIKFGVWFPFIALTGALIWASLAETDVVIQGSGKLVTDLPTIIMKPLERSVIRKIHVRIGDIVKKGQVLITFDPTFNAAEADRLKNEIQALSAQFERLKAEFTHKPFAVGNDQFSRWQGAIYKQRQEYYREKMRYYDEALLQIAASKKNKQDNLTKQQERLVAYKKLEDMYEQLKKSNAASLKDLIQVQISRMEMEATVDQLRNDLLELEHSRGTTLAERNSFIQDWHKSISEEMVNVDRSLTSTRKEYDKTARLIEYVSLRTPCDAVVHEIASFSPGSAVQEAEALITLIPLDGNIELECQIRPQDIGKITLHAPARVKLNAYPFQKYGTLNGDVRNISEDTLDKNEGGMSYSYYRARISVSGKLKHVKPSFRLIPGMEAQCEIKCGKRKVIEYVLYPLIKALDETAREP